MDKKYGAAGIIVAFIIIVSLFAAYPLLTKNPFAPPETTTTTSSSSNQLTTTSTSTSPDTSTSSTTTQSSLTTDTYSSSITMTSTSMTSTNSCSPGQSTSQNGMLIIPVNCGGNGNITVYGQNLNHTQSVNSISVDLRVNGNSFFPNGTLPGIPVTFTGLQYGIAYGVVVYWYGNWYIRYINDTNTGIDLQRYDLVTLSSTHPTDTLYANFENVPPNQSASLNVIAEFPNGTQLGTAQVVNGYDLHSPGMWLTLTPPAGVSPFTGNGNPYTGTFTGGSILPFTLFNQSTYSLQMSLSFCGPWVTSNSGIGPTVYLAWSHWMNDSSTNPTRVISMSQDVTYVGIYDQVNSCPSQTAAPASNVYPATIGLLTLVALALVTPGFGRLFPCPSTKIRKHPVR
ncbi:MAG TPA: hypothetical protein VJN71_11095 [Nitrososphaerales archaeon]|nr:hypothetical protein [Nitrososphaerales archaeon]